MLLYIHVPFCSKRCTYCSFYSMPLGEDPASGKKVTAYLGSLIHEMRLWGERLGKIDISSVFFGGGTPSILPANAIKGMLDQARLNFNISDDAEITIEANPESALEDGWLFEAKKAGVNRLSLGVQSLDNADLSLLGRQHSARSAKAAYETARYAGFSNISLDFMWGLPSIGPHAQSQVQWLRQLREAVEMQPEHISAYGLSLEPGSVLEQSHAQGIISMPTEQAQASLFLAGAEFLESRGYMQYEISNFSRMGYESKHNMGYWEGESYLGLGPAATSTINKRRWSNPEDLGLWLRLVANKKCGKGAELLGPREDAREMLMLRLRMNKGLNLKDWQNLTGRSFLQDNSDLIKKLQQNGLASTRSGWFKLTRSGMLVSDTILAYFFERMDGQTETGQAG